MSFPPSSPKPGERLREGVALFNRGEFFECHEVLEAAWLEAAGEEKRFLQGLIQVAVAFYHLRRENFAGAVRLLRAGMEKLSTPLPQASVDVAGLLEEIRELPSRLERGDVPAHWPAPQIQFLGPQE